MYGGKYLRGMFNPDGKTDTAPAHITLLPYYMERTLVVREQLSGY
jgi:hypothetical protein